MSKTTVQYCFFCKKDFSSKSSLIRHQNTSNNCVKHRDTQSEGEICIYCKKIYKSEKTLKNHLLICKEKNELDYIKQQNIELIERIKTLEQDKIRLEMESNIYENKFNLIKEQLDKLQEKYDNLASHSKVINTTNYNSNTNNNNNLTVKQYVSTLQPITSQDFTNSLNFYTEKYIDEGAIGYAKFLLEHPCSNKIITTDLSRKVVAYRTDKNEFIKDPKCRELIKMAIDDNKNEILELCTNRRKRLAHDQYIDNDSVMYEIYSKKINDITEFIIFLKNDLDDCDDTNVPVKISTQITSSTPQYNNVKTNIQELE